jgi:hypothetical protein
MPLLAHSFQDSEGDTMKPGDCIWYTGTMNANCEKGVCYRALVGGPDLGWMARLPCITTRLSATEGRVDCAAKAPMSQEEYDRQQAEHKAAFAMTSTAIRAIRATGLSEGSIECPKCKKGLHFSVARSNGHIWGRCETGGCLAWMM